MLKKRKLISSLVRKKQKGMAVIEAIPVLFMLVMVFNFSLGFFGAIHSGILNSIGSYNYAFETFRYRSTLVYFRPGAGIDKNYKLAGNRVHGVIRDGSSEATSEEKNVWPATLRGITFNYVKDDPKRNLAGSEDSQRKYADRTSSTNIWFATSEYTPQESSSIQTPRIWLKTVYGMCINADCCSEANNNCKRTGE
jgi:hypothetical protein